MNVCYSSALFDSCERIDFVFTRMLFLINCFLLLVMRLNLFIWRQLFAENGRSSCEFLFWRHRYIYRFLCFNESLTLYTTLFYCEFYPWCRQSLTVGRLRFGLKTWVTALSTMILALQLLKLTFYRVVFMLRLIFTSTPFCFSCNKRLHMFVNGFEIFLCKLRRLFYTDFFRGLTLMLTLRARSWVTSNILLHVTIDFLER